MRLYSRDNTAIDFSSQEPDIIIEDEPSSLKIETVELSRNLDNYFGNDLNIKTETVKSVGIRHLKAIDEKEKKIEPLPQEIQHALNGSVINVYEESVDCEIYTGEPNILISLPLALFPQPDVHPGLPFSLRLDDSTGFRRPIIDHRDIDPNLLNENLDEIEHIIDNL